MPILFILAATILLFLIICLVTDYYGPSKIPLHHDRVFGMDCMRARDLIVQEFDKEGNLWATRGHILYSWHPGEDVFKKRSRIPSSLSPYWLNNFSVIRKLTLRSECVELVTGEGEGLCAFAAGKMWYCLESGQGFHKTMDLPRFGLKIGRGVMSTGLTGTKDGQFYFGEYFSNPERTSVRLYRYSPGDTTWMPAYEFKQGQIRHIHALQKDPYSGRIWICTGDEDHEAMIGWTDDGFRNIHPIGQGSQAWRTCQLIFTREAIYWGADTGSRELAGIYRWDKENMKVKHLKIVDGAVFFGTRLSNGLLLLSTDRENFPNEKDDKTRLLVTSGKEDEVVEITCGTWDYKKPGFRYNFAKLRFQRNQGHKFLAVSVLNQKEFPDAELLLFNEKDILARCTQQIQ